MSRFQDNEPKSASKTDRRRFERFATNQPAELVGDHQHVVVELLDISDLGARIEVRQGLMPNIGEKISLQLFDGTDLEGRVVRIDNNTTVGIEFTARHIDAADLTHHDQMGSGLYQAVLKIQNQRQKQSIKMIG